MRTFVDSPTAGAQIGLHQLAAGGRLVTFRMSGLEHELAQLGGEITLALEDVRLPAALLDRDGVVRWQNRASIEATGNVIGSALTSVVAPHELPEANEFLSRILCRGEPADFTLQVRAATGGYSLREISAAPVREGGSIVGMFGLSRPLSAEHARPPGGAKSSAVELTQRQQDVLHLLAEGRSTGEIASELTLSPTTVRNHVAGLIAALGVHTRLQAVVAAHKLELLDL
jgi:DNA-binding CsgD family transcriptional regulator